MNLPIVLTSNNLRIYLVREKSLNSVVLHLRGLAGSSYESSANVGASHFTEHLVLQGTKNYDNSYRLNSLIIKQGGRIIATTSRDDVLFGVHVLKDYVYDAVTFLSEIFYNATFNPKDFELVQKNIKAEIFRHMDSPEKAVLRKSYKVLFPKGRMGLLNTGAVGDLEKLTLEKVKSFYRQFYVNNRFILYVYGNFDPNNLALNIGEKFRSQKNTPHPDRPAPKINKQFAVQVQKTSGIKQSYTKIDFECEPISSSNRVLAELSAKILYAMTKKQLLGLSYKNSVDHASMRDFGVFSFYTVSSDDKVVKIVKAIKQTILETPAHLPQNVVEICKKALIADIVFTLEKPSMYAQYYSELLLHSESFTTHEDYIEKIKTVSAVDLVDYLNLLSKKNPKITAISDSVTPDQIKKAWLS